MGVDGSDDIHGERWYFGGGTDAYEPGKKNTSTEGLKRAAEQALGYLEQHSAEAGNRNVTDISLAKFRAALGRPKNSR